MGTLFNSTAINSHHRIRSLKIVELSLNPPAPSPLKMYFYFRKKILNECPPALPDFPFLKIACNLQSLLQMKLFYYFICE